MEWTPDNNSSDVEDRRDDSGGGFGGGGGGGFGGGGIGIVGFLILLVISLVTGRNFIGAFLQGGGAPTQQVQPMNPGGAPRPHSAAEDKDEQLMQFTLNDVQKTWAGIFQEEGRPYTHAKLVIYRGETNAGCGGVAESSTGPFYCPEDKKVYIDLNFWDELRRFGGSTADFAQSFVLAHELGHHVQNLLGTMNRVQRLEQQEPGQRNHLSVETELQADCYGGVWANSAQKRGIVDPGDIDAALSAVAAVGDDHLQKMSGRSASPESWTHGSSAQRQMWFKKGFESGDPASCNTFAGGGN
jgi:predicted metalloprotease